MSEEATIEGFIEKTEKALLEYNRLCDLHDNHTPMSGDHHTGSCFVFFKGTEDDCEKVKKFLEETEDE